MRAQRRGGRSRLPTRTTTSCVQGVPERASASPPLSITSTSRGNLSDELTHIGWILHAWLVPSHGLIPLRVPLREFRVHFDCCSTHPLPSGSRNVAASPQGCFLMSEMSNFRAFSFACVSARFFVVSTTPWTEPGFI